MSIKCRGYLAVNEVRGSSHVVNWKEAGVGGEMFQNIVLKFAFKDWRKPQVTSILIAVVWLGFEMATSRIQVIFTFELNWLVKC
jgi:hypothetical protein